MSELELLGLLLVIVAGLMSGSGAWPFKVTPDLRLEKFILFNVGTAFLVIPWAIAFCCLDVPEVLQSLDRGLLLRSFLFSTGWGIANVLYLVCVIKIGAALTGAILSALGLSVSMIIPMVLKGSGNFQNAPDLWTLAGLFIVISIILIVVSVSLLTFAGFQREKGHSVKSESERKKMASGRFLEGLLLVTLAGILSAGLSLSFIYIQDDIMKATRAQGMSDVLATSVVWGIGTFGGVLVNLGFACFMLVRHGTWKTLFARMNEPIFGICVGAIWFFSLLCYGMGMVYLGPLGATVGAGIQQATALLSNQSVGFLGGEWRGIFGRPRHYMYAGVFVTLLAIAVMTMGNRIADQSVKNPPAEPAGSIEVTVLVTGESSQDIIKL